MIPVSKPYLPDRARFERYLDRIYGSSWLTNHGPLSKELHARLADFLGIDAELLILVSNGSSALHLAYKALDITGEVITTPFSFVASSSTLVWDHLTPVYCDIDPETFNLNPALIEASITSETSAILPVHVFGNPCEVDTIARIAKQRNLKTIYDASHAFGTEVDGKSVLSYGDISTVSFHATKLFHTVEGGAIIARDKTLAEKVRLLLNFGMDAKGKICRVGTNAKLSELHSAMGLSVLDEFDLIQQERKRVFDKYLASLSGLVGLQKFSANAELNHSYFPILLKSESIVLRLIEVLASKDISARRYFNPSLDTVFGSDMQFVNSRDIASRIVCLPLYAGLEPQVQNVIIHMVKSVVRGEA